MPHKTTVSPEEVLGAIYGKTSVETGLSEKRRDELIAAAIYASFRNQEFGTRLRFPADYRLEDWKNDAAGIDVIVKDRSGREKKLQIKGVYIQRSIERRRKHSTAGGPAIAGRRTQRMIRRDSEELTRIMEHELSKIIQDYSGLILIIHVIADFATQTSLEIAIRSSFKIVANLKAREVWFMRQVPVRLIHGHRSARLNSYAYNLFKVSPDRRTYGFCFTL